MIMNCRRVHSVLALLARIEDSTVKSNITQRIGITYIIKLSINAVIIDGEFYIQRVVVAYFVNIFSRNC